MTAAITTIPEKIYVTFRREGQGEDAVRLGFSSPFTGDAPFDKRKSSQDRWAYGTSFLNDDGKTVVKDTSYQYDEVAQKNVAVTHEALVEDHLQPAYFSNEPLAGFQISRSVRRYGWNSGNTVWRIADPRGFELEISSANFARIVDCTTLEKGAIANRCVWGRCGNENILLPESSDIFIDAQKETARRSTTVKVGELTPGDVVDLIGGINWEGGPATYLGKHWILGVAHTTVETSTGTSGVSSSWSHRSTRTETTGWKYNTNPMARYIFEMANGEFVGGTAPKISSIIEKAQAPLDKAVTAQRLCGANIGGAGYGAQWFVWPAKIDHTKISLSFKPAADKAERIRELKEQNLENRIGVVRANGKFHSFGRLYNSAAGHLNQLRYQPVLVALEPLDPKAGHIKYEQNGQAVNQLFGGKTTFLRMSEYEEEELDGMEPFDLWLEYDGKYELKVPMVTPYSFSALP